jgi:hypothetical protein
MGVATIFCGLFLFYLFKNAGIVIKVCTSHEIFPIKICLNTIRCTQPDATIVFRILNNKDVF